MFKDAEVDKFLETRTFSKDLTNKLLNLYVAEGDWTPHIVRFADYLERKNYQEAKETLAQAVAFTILFPVIDKSVKIDTNELGRNLFTWYKFHQFKEKEDWVKELQKVLRRDKEIKQWRREILQLGIIDPIEYVPYCRQAHKWLCRAAEDSGVQVNDLVSQRFRKLVMAYGGKSISYMFTETPQAVRKVHNWRSGYFFERMLYRVFKDVTELKQVKQRELQSLDPEYIKQVTL